MYSLVPQGLFSSLAQQTSFLGLFVGCYCRSTSGALLQRGSDGSGGEEYVEDSSAVADVLCERLLPLNTFSYLTCSWPQPTD